MNKEWLEEITSSVGILSNGDRHVLLRRKHYEWLIKQAERAEELEKKVERYREALEFYANEETYEMKFTANTDEISVPLTVIELDEGKKARRALDGE